MHKIILVLTELVFENNNVDGGGGMSEKARKRIRKMASKEKNFSCEQCSKTFRKLAHLNTHIGVHEGN